MFMDRYLYWESIRYETDNNMNSVGAKWFRFHLLVRDFFHLYCAKNGARVFSKYGVTKNTTDGNTRTWRRDEELETRWKEGRTGVPIVDANMRELKLTGWMGNRGRQIVASYLVHDLQVRKPCVRIAPSRSAIRVFSIV